MVVVVNVAPSGPAIRRGLCAGGREEKGLPPLNPGEKDAVPEKDGLRCGCCNEADIASFWNEFLAGEKLVV